MKSLAVIFSYLSTPQAKRNLRALGILLGVFVAMVAVYSTVFHAIMDREGQTHSWPTSVYWTLVVMSTLGFGDITFESDLGRVFSVVVLLSGSVFILVLLPFTFVQFVYVPLMEARQRARAPRELPERIAGHVLLTRPGPIEDALVLRLSQGGIPYAIIESDLEQALALHDRGYSVLLGDTDDPDTYRAARIDRAAMLVTTRADSANANIAFTAREICDSVEIIGTASASASVDILQLAGCDHVLQLGEMLGRALAARVLAPGAQSHVVGEMGGVLIAEAPAPPSLVGLSLRDAELRERVGLTVAGIWDRGEFQIAGPDTVISPRSLLLLAGSRPELETYDRRFGTGAPETAPVVIIGGGRVGRACGRALAEAGLGYRIVEKLPDRVRDPETYVLGDAAELEVLERGGIRDSSSVVVTTHDDDVNVYLTIYCRQLRPDVQIIARSNLDRNITTLYRAGADFVLSYASTGATAIWNVLSADDTLQLAEGLDVFRIPVPAALAGRSLADERIRQVTGCNVVAVIDGGEIVTNPPATRPLPQGSSLVVIGDPLAEERLRARYRPS